MSLRAFAKFARFGRDLKDWTEIADVDTALERAFAEASCSQAGASRAPPSTASAIKVPTEARCGNELIRPGRPQRPILFLENQQRRGLRQRLLLAVQIALQLLIRLPQLAQLLRLLTLAGAARRLTNIRMPRSQIMRKDPAFPAPGVQRLLVQAMTLL